MEVVEAVVVVEVMEAVVVLDDRQMPLAAVSNSLSGCEVRVKEYLLDREGHDEWNDDLRVAERFAVQRRLQQLLDQLLLDRVRVVELTDQQQRDHAQHHTLQFGVHDDSWVSG